MVLSLKRADFKKLSWTLSHSDIDEFSTITVIASTLLAFRIPIAPPMIQAPFHAIENLRKKRPFDAEAAKGVVLPRPSAPSWMDGAECETPCTLRSRAPKPAGRRWNVNRPTTPFSMPWR